MHTPSWFMPCNQSFQWKITVARVPNSDYYQIVVWERLVVDGVEVPWTRTVMGGLWEMETLGHHRKAFARAISKLLH